MYCASANKDSIGIYGTNLGLQESSQHSGGGSWELLTVENVTLDAADASIQYRLIVDTGTAYFTMPMLNIGSKALPWTPRGEQFVPLTLTRVRSATTGDVAWSDLDVTANTDPLAVKVLVQGYVKTDVAGDTLSIGHSDDLVADAAVVLVYSQVNNVFNTGQGEILLNDSQVCRIAVAEADADSDVLTLVDLHGYWRWAP